MERVSVNSSQFKQILFRIRLSLADPSICIQQAYKYSNEFDPKHVNHMKIDCALIATDWKQAQIQSVREGHSVRNVFQAGHIQSEKTQSKIFLFKLAVNQALPIHKSGATELQTLTEFPPGIDTVYVVESKQQLNIYPHKYRVKEKSQCCLEYEVDFIRGKQNNSDKWNPNQIICQNCEVALAIHYCTQDRQVLCGKCYQQLHRNSRKKNHKQQKLSPFNCSTRCSLHSQEKQIYYCLNCMQLKCELCIQNQTHKNVKKHTQIMLLTELQISLKQKQVQFLKQSKQKTKQMIVEAEDVLSKIQKVYQLQKRSLEQKFAQKLSKIRELSNEKITKVVALHAELRRKMDELLWAQSYVQYCENFLLAEQNIDLRDVFFVYLQRITTKQYYLNIRKQMGETIS